MKRRTKFLEFSNDILVITETKDLLVFYHTFWGWVKNLKIILQNNGLKVALRGSNALTSFFINSEKDWTSVEQQSGVYKIPSTCGSSYVGRTNHNLKMRLLQRHNSISSSLKQDFKPDDFTSDLSEHISIIQIISFFFRMFLWFQGTKV